MGYNVGENNCTNSTEQCTFDLINGYGLAGIGTLGFLMSTAAIICLHFNIIKLPGSKKIFLINVALNDALMGLIAVPRGLSIISPHFMGVGDDGSVSWYCYFFPFPAYFVWDSIMFTLLPLTVDRFIALVFPTKYRDIMTPKVSKAMVITSWLPAVITHLIYDPVRYAVGTMEVKYQPSYNRCVFDVKPILPIMTLMVPLIAIALMYLIIAISIVKNKIPVGRLLVTTTAILLTGVTVAIPQVIMVTAKLTLSYEVAQICTVTLYHCNCIFNPVIYFIANPRIALQMKEHAGATARSFKEQLTKNLEKTVSGFNLTYIPDIPEDLEKRPSVRKEEIC